jgi:uncharacterized protein (DUF934 family)
MRRIIRRRELVADDARYDGEPPEPGTRAVLSLAQFLAASASASGTAAAAPDAVQVGPVDAIESLVPHLAALRLIVIEFPKVGEGRGYTQARLLRQRLGFQGELRARGALKRDQLFFLARCGFDSFELDPSEDALAALSALDSFSVAYQDGSGSLVQPQRRERA